MNERQRESWLLVEWRVTQTKRVLENDTLLIAFVNDSKAGLAIHGANELFIDQGSIVRRFVW